MSGCTFIGPGGRRCMKMPHGPHIDHDFFHPDAPTASTDGAGGDAIAALGLSPEVEQALRNVAAEIGGAYKAERDRLTARVQQLERERDTPELYDFQKAVVLEAQHQRARWGNDHDAGKTDADWFWLIGYLAGKALHNPDGDLEKQLHRIVTVAAAAANWHAAKLGKTKMRPGTEGDAALSPAAREGGRE